jgi:hypothetical protein
VLLPQGCQAAEATRGSETALGRYIATKFVRDDAELTEMKSEIAAEGGKEIDHRPGSSAGSLTPLNSPGLDISTSSYCRKLG